ncbi:hypothetical protein F5Y16DRAFT_393624 [Xylariaceae sp. FL0255]|nr:hypothetical protein F5Y16DRAFT_393624 [Xylariaceae sp. FL0255]
MGLAAQRNKRKLDHDPNNTRWTRDETTFGQKILRAQGWEPGKFLGAEGASHAEFHSAASFVPIKINLKDDTLGLGAKIRQKQTDECTGLDAFKDLLGRLNGKSETALEKEQQIRSEIKTNLYLERRYRPMRFVSGGLLVGDQNKIEQLASDSSKSSDKTDSKAVDVDSTGKRKKEKSSKKRKAADSEESTLPDRKSEKKQKRSSVADGLSGNSPKIEVVTSKKSKKGGKSKKPKGLVEEVDEKQKKTKKHKDSSRLPGSQNPLADDNDRLEKAKRKEKKEKKREKRRKGKEDDQLTVAVTSEPSTSEAAAAVSEVSGFSTPMDTGASTPRLSVRYHSRARHIASKRMAFSDMKALNQIFMIKPV